MGCGHRILIDIQWGKMKNETGRGAIIFDISRYLYGYIKARLHTRVLLDGLDHGKIKFPLFA